MILERFPTRRTSVIAVVALLLGAVGLVVFALRSNASADSIQRRSAERDAVVDVSREAAIAFTSYDYRDLAKSFSRLEAVATKDFAEQFKQASNELTPLILKKRARSSGRVLAVSVEKSPETAIAGVLVAADATVRNVDLPKGAVQRFRLRIELERQGGSWLVKSITPVV